MDYSLRWKIIDELGEGGQGKVFRVYDLNRFSIDSEIVPSLQRGLMNLTASIITKELIEHGFPSFRKAILDMVALEDTRNHFALKILHRLEPKEAEKAEARITKEIKVMSEINHPNLLRIIDSDSSLQWFVCPYYENGTLVNHRSRFTGNVREGLPAFRSIVLAVSELHRQGVVHRDIKPENVFVDKEGHLILGDLGLVFFMDSTHSRVSETYENVGSRDWMPTWAYRVKLDEVRPTFDVFSLGKLLWAMLSKTTYLQLWYFKDQDYNLEKMFPDKPEMKFVNQLLEKCIVEYEQDCQIKDANDFLVELDALQSLIQDGVEFIDFDSPHSCKVCGRGKYERIISYAHVLALPYGTPIDKRLRIFSCTYCGHVQTFFTLPTTQLGSKALPE